MSMYGRNDLLDNKTMEKEQSQNMQQLDKVVLPCPLDDTQQSWLLGSDEQKKKEVHGFKVHHCELHDHHYFLHCISHQIYHSHHENHSLPPPQIKLEVEDVDNIECDFKNEHVLHVAGDKAQNEQHDRGNNNDNIVDCFDFRECTKPISKH